LSIGSSNIFIGLLGGFPVCHGAGGIAGHARFGGKTGGTTIIIGAIFVLAAFIKPLSSVLLYIPIPILGGLLCFESWCLASLIKRLTTKPELIVCILVGMMSFIIRNLTIAILVGFLVEKGYSLYLKKFTLPEQKK
jgi:MFS superfamily sulfate permease-like transporter